MRNEEDEERLNRRNRRVGEWLDVLERGRGVKGLTNGVIRDVRLKMATEEDPMVLMIVRAQDGTGPKVAFVGAGSAGGALLAWRKLDAGAGLRWREDRPWVPQGA